MSHKRPATHLSCPSVRYSPYSRLHGPASTRLSSIPPGQNSPPSDEGGMANDLSVTDVSSESVHDNHPSALHPNYLSPQHSFYSNHMLESSNFQNMFPQESAPLEQIPSCPPTMGALYPGLPQCLYPQPSADISYPDSTASCSAYLPSNPQLRRHCSTNQQGLQILQDETPGTVPPVPQSIGHQGQGMFSGSHHLLLSGNSFINYNITSDNFMEKFLQSTIIGAEHDSSDRHPPPQCHPGTRLAIVDQCKTFIAECKDKKKMRWVFGPAGVGKSAIMQMVAEETPADASVFLSVNGRRDGTKTFTTIAYQLAAKYELYQQFIRGEIHRDPTLLRKSLPVQFRKFIIDPFIHRPLFHPSHQILVIIDGLDECDDLRTQVELLKLIAEFCIKYPASPIAWLIASRPEPHITSFFDDNRIMPAYTKEEIMINSNEACEDVQRYIRNELNEIKRAYPKLRRNRQWPSELEFTKIAKAACGLFAYASTVVRYIGDPYHRKPVTRLGHVLATINGIPRDDASGSNHPMVQLDALYHRILSNIPADTMINTRKLLLINSTYGWQYENFRSQCNKLGLSEDVAYGAVSHLNAVVKVPSPDKADDDSLEYLHKSFADFLHDPRRSTFSQNFRDEVGELRVQSSLRILHQEFDRSDDDVPLSWPGDERFPKTDEELWSQLCDTSIDDICSEFGSGKYLDFSVFDFLTTRWDEPHVKFPFTLIEHYAFRDFRSKLTELGKLIQVPLRTLDYAAICRKIFIWFIKPSEYSDACDLCCRHPKISNCWDEDSLQPQQGWFTAFARFFDDPQDETRHSDIPRFNVRGGEDFHHFPKPEEDSEDPEPEVDDENSEPRLEDACLYCSQRLAHHFIDNPDQLVTVFIDSTEMCYVELSFIDPNDGVSKWTCEFLHSGRPTCID